MENRTECTIPCNLCDSRSVETLSLKDRRGGYLRTVVCTGCGLIWIDPRPAEEEIRNFYSKEYRKEYKGIARPEKKHLYRHARGAMERYDFFKDVLTGGESLLDIGAGDGVFLYCIRKLGIKAEGVEPDQNHAGYAREVLRVPVTTGFARDINLKNSFNIVTLNHVLEHMADPFGELKHIWSMLRENGYLVVEVPSAEDVWQDPNHRYHKAHLYTFNPETLTALGQKAGFKVVRKNIAPLNGNISVIFQKCDDSEGARVDLTGNVNKIKKTLGRHTTFHHFLTATPYIKPLQSLAGAVSELISVIGIKNDEDIIDKVVSRRS